MPISRSAPPRRFARTVACMTVALATPPVMAETRDDSRRMLGQLNVMVHRATASACMLNAGIAVEDEAEDIARATHVFNKKLGLLNDGHVRPEVVDIVSSWRPVDAALTDILAGGPTDASLATVLESQAALEDATIHLEDVIGSEFNATSRISEAQILLIDLAERQLNFAHTMKLKACLIGSGGGDPAVTDELLEMMTFYEASLTVMRDGSPDYDLHPLAMPQMKEVLDEAITGWDALRPMLEKIATDGNATDDELLAIRDSTQTQVFAMNTLLMLYLGNTILRWPDPETSMMSKTEE